MNQQAFDALVDQVREAFVAKAKKIKPWYNSSPKDEESFLKVAKICESLGADPIVYVESQFENYHNINHIQAAFMHSQYSEVKYNEYLAKNIVEDTVINYEDIYQVQLSYLRNLIKSGLTVEEALMKDYVNFAPWFRILICKKVIPEIVKKYKPKLGKLDKGLLAFLKNKGKFDLSRLS
jgi:hypothetical protein